MKKESRQMVNLWKSCSERLLIPIILTPEKPPQSHCSKPSQSATTLRTAQTQLLHTSLPKNLGSTLVPPDGSHTSTIWLSSINRLRHRFLKSVGNWRRSISLISSYTWYELR